MMHERRTKLALGAALGLGLIAGLAGAGLLLWRRLAGRAGEAEAPAAAFSSPVAAPGAPVQTRDAGPAAMRDGEGAPWDARDEASDESFPASDPPASQDFRAPAPIDPSPRRPH
jgi:hypothetical protein